MKINKKLTNKKRNFTWHVSDVKVNGHDVTSCWEKPDTFCAGRVINKCGKVYVDESKNTSVYGAECEIRYRNFKTELAAKVYVKKMQALAEECYRKCSYAEVCEVCNKENATVTAMLKNGDGEKHVCKKCYKPLQKTGAISILHYATSGRNNIQ